MKRKLARMLVAIAREIDFRSATEAVQAGTSLEVKVSVDMSEYDEARAKIEKDLALFERINATISEGKR